MACFGGSIYQWRGISTRNWLLCKNVFRGEDCSWKKVEARRFAGDIPLFVHGHIYMCIHVPCLRIELQITVYTSLEDDYQSFYRDPYVHNIEGFIADASKTTYTMAHIYIYI